MKFNNIEKMQQIIKAHERTSNFSDKMQTVTVSDIGEFTGYLWGNDECFEDYGAFYHWLTCTDGYIYKLYFTVPEDYDGDLGNVDYSKAYDCVKYELYNDFDLDGFNIEKDNFYFGYDVCEVHE